MKGSSPESDASRAPQSAESGPCEASSLLEAVKEVRGEGGSGALEPPGTTEAEQLVPSGSQPPPFRGAGTTSRTAGSSAAEPDVSEAEVSRLEPLDQTLLADEARLDRIAHIFAEVVDAKSPWTCRHGDQASAA